MAFKPIQQKHSNTTSTQFEQRNYPTPKSGSRPARISLIVDLGIQEREDFEDKATGETKPQKPVQQVVVFADLVNDVVDYGGEIGKMPYRLCLNKTFQGETQGVNFTAVPPRDQDGNQIQGKAWGFHPQNLLTKIAKAIQKPEVIESMDIEEFLNEPLMAQVEVKKTESKDKKDDDGNPVVYTNVNYRGASEVPMVEDDDGNEAPMKIKPLASPAMIISFDEAKPEQIKYLRKNLIAKIKTAKNYAGSAMQKAIEAFEKQQNAQQGTSEGQGEVKKEEPRQVSKAPQNKLAKKVVEAPADDDDDTDIPF